MLVDSTRPWDSPESSAAWISSRCFTMRRCSVTNASIPHRRAHEIHPSRACLALVAGQFERVPQAILEQVDPIQEGVCSGDPGELGVLVLAQRFGVLPQRPAGTIELLRLSAGTPCRAPIDGAAGPVPRGPTNLVHRVPSPLHDVERANVAQGSAVRPAGSHREPDESGGRTHGRHGPGGPHRRGVRRQPPPDLPHPHVSRPFHAGNGFAQREFVSALARSSGPALDWRRVSRPVHDFASLRARRDRDLGPLTALFGELLAHTVAE